ncbi:MAG: hypothetical protein PF481_02790 [Bacteroidales bacterium]|jgi:hypothetical protein|nr:hypothetical protein [Bacteroidales bacterium]
MSEINIAILKQYENFIRNNLNSIVQKINKEKLSINGVSFLTKIKERLGFDDENGWKFLTTSLDTIGDSLFAIETFINNKVDNTKTNITAENYLRLYGLLSAVYIQQKAILKLADLFKITEYKNIKKDFDNLKITFLRHCISAHPINYNNNGKKVSFKIDRNSVNNKEILCVRDDSNNVKKYNVFNSLNDYTIQAERSLELISKKLILNCYKVNKEKYDDSIIILNNIKNAKHTISCESQK